MMNYRIGFGKTALLAATIAVSVAGCKTAAPPASESPAPAPTASVPSKPPATPYTKKHIYSETADPQAEIAAAFKQAKAEHKRVLLDFGGDWCGDCQVLDIYFHQEPNQQLLEKNFVLTHVFIGQLDKNVELAAKYGVPLKKGVPALSVIDPSGKVVHAQGTGEFEDMRHMNAESVTEFLDRWKS